MSAASAGCTAFLVGVLVAGVLAVAISLRG